MAFLFLEKYSYRLRVNVCRQPNNIPITTQMVCGIGIKDRPINGDNTIPLTLETTMTIWNIDEDERSRLIRSVKRGSERVLQRIIDDENELSIGLRGGPGAQTDMIGKYRKVLGL